VSIRAVYGRGYESRRGILGAMTKRGGPRPGGGRPKVPIEEDPDREFIVIWRLVVQLLGSDSRNAGKLAAHLVSAEPIILSDFEGILRVAGATVKHYTDDLDSRIDALVRKAQRSSDSDPWIAESESAIGMLTMATFALARPNLSDDARERFSRAAKFLVDRLEALGWGEFRARLEGRINAGAGSNLPPHDSPLGREGRRLLELLKERTKKNSRLIFTERRDRHDLRGPGALFFQR
jgi:hypothetical protein